MKDAAKAAKKAVKDTAKIEPKAKKVEREAAKKNAKIERTAEKVEREATAKKAVHAAAELTMAARAAKEAATAERECRPT